MKEVALIFIGSGIGGVLRYGTGLLFAWLLPAFCFPYATFTVNIIGSFLMGLFFGQPYSGTIFYMAMIGFCGGFTTFSALSTEGMAMLRSGQVMLFGLYVVLTVIMGVAAAWGGFLLSSKC